MKEVIEVEETTSKDPEVEVEEPIESKTSLTMDNVIPAGEGGGQVGAEPEEKITMQNTEPLVFVQGKPTEVKKVKKKSPILLMSSLPPRSRR